MNTKYKSKNDIRINHEDAVLNLPDWKNFNPTLALRELKEVYKKERVLIDKLSLSSISVQELFQARSALQIKALNIIGDLFHLERVAKSQYVGISEVTRKASTLIEKRSQYLIYKSNYQKMIESFSELSQSMLSKEDRWYLIREKKEIESWNKEGSDKSILMSLRTELDKLENEYRKGDVNNDAYILKMINLRSEIARHTSAMSWNEQCISGLMMSDIGVKRISALLLKIKNEVKSLLSQKLEDYRTAMFSERYSKDDVFFFVQDTLSEHFNITLQPRKVSTWNSSVQYFDVFLEGEGLIGGLYFDLWSRKEKFRGAWSGALRNGEESVLPLAMVVTNFQPRKNISHHELITLIHETGHAVHYLLSRPKLYLGYVRYLEDDAVEIVGRFFERFAFDKNSIKKVLQRKTYKLTKSSEVFLKKLSRYQRAYYVNDRSFDVAVSLFDWDIHLYPPKNSGELHTRWVEAHDQVVSYEKADKTHFPNYMRTIFDGKHSGIFLIYIWSDIVAAQLYRKYQRKSKTSSFQAKNALRELLRKGSSAPMKESLRPIIGSKIQTDAYTDEMTAN